MKIETTFLHSECKYSISQYYVGFRMVTPQKGDHYVGKKYAYNTVVFMLEGEVEFSYNEHTNWFKKGDLIFIPHASQMHGVALTDAVMLVQTYDHQAENDCSNCVLSSVRNCKEELHGIQYEFKPLKMTSELVAFAELMDYYLSNDFRCMHLHQLKQRELFILMQHYYTQKELLEFFYPIIGANMTFRSKVMSIAHEQLSVVEYAKRMNMSTRNFSRRFNAEFGQSVYQWMLQRKIVQVRLKLSMPEVSVEELVQEFRFADASHFYRFCRDYLGFTAKELMLQLRLK